ncbi:MAG TPA: hypothetical protein VGX23_16010 [Actinocrinis sp.]|nr:hypothetical protein [Actinocrinis sp.]
MIRDHVLHDHLWIVRSWTERHLEALRGHCIGGRWDRLAPTYDAALDRLSYLMVATDRDEELRTLLFDLRFMVRRIRQGGTAGLLSDLGDCESSRGRDPELRALELIIGLEGHLALRADADGSAPGGVQSVAATLWARLVGDPTVSGLVTHRDESLLEVPVALHPMPDRPDTRLVHVYDGHTDRVVAVSWRADGDRLATGTADGAVHIWDVRGSRQRVVRFEAAVSALAWSPDHLHLAVLTGEYGLCLIEPIHGDVTTFGFASGNGVEADDADRGVPLAELTCLAWMPHGLAIGRGDGDVVLWEIGEDRVTRAISHPGSAVRAMQWSDVLSGLVAVHADGVFTVLHDVSAGGGRERVTAQTGLNVPRALAVRADGTEVVIGAAQNELLMLDAAAPEAAAISTPTTGWSTSVGWSADGTWIAAGLQDGAVALWSETGSEPGHAGYVDVLLDDETPQRRGWSERFANQQRIDYHGQRVAAVSWHPLQPQLAVAAQKDLRVYDLQRGAENESRHGVNCLCRHPNRDLFAAGGMDGEIILTKAADLAWRRTVEVFTSPVRSIAFSPDGDRLAVLADDGRLLLWDTRALLEEDATIDGSVSSIMCPVDQPGAVAWTPDGAALAIGGNKLVVLLDSTTLGELRRFPVADLVNGLAVDPGGQWIATATSGSEIAVHDLSGRPELVLTGHSSSVGVVRWLGDGRLVSGGYDGYVMFWSPWADPADRLLRRIEPGGGAVWDVALSRTALVTVTSAGMLGFHPLTKDEAPVASCVVALDTALSSCAVSADGTTVAAGGSAGTALFALPQWARGPHRT